MLQKETFHGLQKDLSLGCFVELEKLLQLGLHIITLYYICLYILYGWIWGLNLPQADSSFPLFERYRGMQLGVVNCRNLPRCENNQVIKFFGRIELSPSIYPQDLNSTVTASTKDLVIDDI